MTAVRTSPFPRLHGARLSEDRPRRELKRALESYWDGRSTREELRRRGRRAAGADLAAAGRARPGRAAVQHLLALRPGAGHRRAARRGARALRGRPVEDPYFAMARGTEGSRRCG